MIKLIKVAKVLEKNIMTRTATEDGIQPCFASDTDSWESISITTYQDTNNW